MILRSRNNSRHNNPFALLFKLFIMKKKTNLFYWIFTILFAAMMLFSAIPNIMVNQQSVELVSNYLGYPVYIIAFLGIAKLLGAIALFIPGYPRMKEWAYAGLTFDLIGATYSMIAKAEPISGWIFMIVPFSLMALSYYFYHKKIKQSELVKERAYASA